MGPSCSRADLTAASVLRSTRGHFGYRGIDGRLRARDDRDCHALGSERFGDAFSNALAAAEHQRSFSFNLQIHLLLHHHYSGIPKPPPSA